MRALDRAGSNREPTGKFSSAADLPDGVSTEAASSIDNPLTNESVGRG